VPGALTAPGRSEANVFDAGSDPVEPAALVVLAWRGERCPGKLLGVEPVRALLRVVLALGERLGQRLGCELVTDSHHVLRGGWGCRVWCGVWGVGCGVWGVGGVGGCWGVLGSVGRDLNQHRVITQRRIPVVLVRGSGGGRVGGRGGTQTQQVNSSPTHSHGAMGAWLWGRLPSTSSLVSPQGSKPRPAPAAPAGAMVAKGGDRRPAAIVSAGSVPPGASEWSGPGRTRLSPPAKTLRVRPYLKPVLSLGCGRGCPFKRHFGHVWSAVGRIRLPPKK